MHDNKKDIQDAYTEGDPASDETRIVDTPGAKGEGTQRLSDLEAEKRMKICGRYQRVQFLGRGAFGRVWRCRDEVAGIDVAIKQLPPELVSNPGQVEGIRKNFQVIERLHHPHIAAAKTLEADPGTGEAYLVMEYVPGRGLDRLLLNRGGRMSLEEVLGIARQVAGALDFCHGHNLIHRDIKPGNIIVSEEGVAKVLDFGLAAEFETTVAGVGRDEEPKSIVTGGTWCFMPPEQWRGEHMDGRTDQYALAATMYKLLSGAAPFEGAPNTTALMAAVENEPVPRIDGLDDRVWAAMKKALSKARKKRFDTCTQFIEACEGLSVVTPSPWRRPTRWLAVAAACAAVAVAGHYLGDRLGRTAGTGAGRAPILPPASPLGLTYHALVIGINDYQARGGWPDLVNARKDAEDVARVLRDRYGFARVDALLDGDATRGRILQEIEDMALSLDVTQALFIFFAGHGEYSEELDEGYWIPADGLREDADPQAKAGWIKNLEITSLLEASDARHVLVVADSCYAGALTRGSAPAVTAVQTNKAALYSRLLNRTSRYVIASGEYWEEAYDSGLENSPFTQYLLGTLRQNTNRWMSAFELAQTIRPPYHEHTGNTIRVGPLLRKGGGQFVFDLGSDYVAGNLELESEPEPLVSENPVASFAVLTRSGHTNAANRLLRKMPEQMQTNALVASVSSYFEAARAPESAARLDEMIDYLQKNPPELDPQLEQALKDFARPRVLVVLGPEDQSLSQRGRLDETLWRSGLTEWLRTAGGLRVFDRANLEEALFEIKLSTTDASDARARAMVGQLLPASLLVTGEYFPEGNEGRVFLRLLAAESAEVLGAFEYRVDDPAELPEVVASAAEQIHARALAARPLRAKVIRAEGDDLQAAVGRFHGAGVDSRFDVLRRTKQEHVLFEEYRDAVVGTAAVKYLGENTVDLDPAWAETVPAGEYDKLWVREMVQPKEGGG